MILHDGILVMLYNRTYLRPIRQKSLCGGIRPSFAPPSLGAFLSLPFLSHLLTVFRESCSNVYDRQLSI